MSSTVLNINNSISIDELKLKIEKNNIKYIHYDHSVIGNDNIILLSRKNSALKEKLILMSNYGFMTYVLRGGISSLVHLSEIKNLWIPVKNKTLEINDDNIVFEYHDAEIKSNKKLLVIFSQIPLEPHSASLSRYFSRSFSTVEKYIGKNTAILRIADLGGITGAFYLNTKAQPRNEELINKLIINISEKNKIKKCDIVLYGASKGGTAAFYHSLNYGMKSVCVDPILDDHYYTDVIDDFHLVNGIFPNTKKEKFSKLIEEKKHDVPDIKMIISENSEQYVYIKTIIEPIKNKILVINSTNSSIKKHPDVGPNTIHAITALLNASLIGLKIKEMEIDFI